MKRVTYFKPLVVCLYLLIGICCTLVGKVYSLGRKEYGRLGMGDAAIDLAVPTPIPALQSQKCVEVAAGESVSLAVTESGKHIFFHI